MKIIWHRTSIQTLLFQGVENRDKAYCMADYLLEF